MPMPPPPPPSGLLFDNNKKDNKSSDGRDLLLDSIRKGTKLKKTHTVDKSQPVLGKVVGSSTSKTSSSGNNASSYASKSSNLSSGSGDLPLAGLFINGMPKLKPVGSRSKDSMQSYESNPSNRKPVERAGQTQSVLEQKSISNGKPKSNPDTSIKPITEIKRGPPPQPPTHKSQVPLSISDSTIDGFSSNKPLSAGSMANLSSASNFNIETKKHAKTSSNINLSQSNVHMPNKSTLFANKSNLHASLNSLNQSNKLSTADNSGNLLNLPNSKIVINHGKPNLAPKPPSLNTTSKANVMRAHSMKSPRTPVTPTGLMPFGTLRGPPAGFHFSQDSIKMKPAPPVPPISRPNIPPPIRPPANRPPPPPSRSTSTTITDSVNNNQQQERPALPNKLSLAQSAGSGGSKSLLNLTSGVYNASMGVPPPPPPHRSQPAPQPPIVHNETKAVTNNAPVPPIRNSSMRNCNGNNGNNMSAVILDLETRFSDMFHPVKDFPQPMTFCEIRKTYSSKNQNKIQNNSVNKQLSFSKPQAPLPPSQTPTIQLGRKLYSDNTSEC